METKTLMCSLRPGFIVKLDLPYDFSKKEAERLKHLIDFEVSIGTERRKTKRKPSHSVIDEVMKNREEKGA